MVSSSSAGEFLYTWEGKDAQGKLTRGEMLANGEALVSSTLRRQGIITTRVVRKRGQRNSRISEKDITIFTRQLATMLRAGIPLLQAFDILAQGQGKLKLAQVLRAISNSVETGSSLSDAFRKHPPYFNALYCNLVAAGEQAGILEQMLERLAIYKEKTIAIKSRVRSAMIYPLAILAVAVIVVSVIMIFVIPPFKETFQSFGAELPTPTLVVVAISDFMVNNIWIILGILGLGIYYVLRQFKQSKQFRARIDRMMLKLPIFGEVFLKAVLARWSRTLSTMFSSGITLVDALDTVGAASGNIVYEEASIRVRQDVHTGTSLTSAMQATGQFPHMVTQMVSIGEESGSLDQMLDKVADFYEREVDEAVSTLSSMMEPLIMVILGVLIGALVIALYLPIFKMGSLF